MDEKETIMKLLAWLYKKDYLNTTSLEYDYDEHSYIDFVALAPEEVYEEYMDWLENKNN